MYKYTHRQKPFLMLQYKFLIHVASCLTMRIVMFGGLILKNAHQKIEPNAIRMHKAEEMVQITLMAW